MEKISKRVNAIEEVNNNVKLLTEMVTNYSKGETTESNEDLMKVRKGLCKLWQFCITGSRSGWSILIHVKRKSILSVLKTDTFIPL